MLYSIGYQKLKSVEDLIKELQARDIKFLVDVRSKPYGRKFAFNRKALEAALPGYGIRYQWCGENLGGFARIKDSAIAALSTWQHDRCACLMCMEADPRDCHRHYEIAERLKKLGIPVGHILTAENPTRVWWTILERRPGIEPGGFAGSKTGEPSPDAHSKPVAENSPAA